MAEHDIVAVLAAQVDQLHRKVERCQAIVTGWNTRLETEGPCATMVVLARLKQFGERLDEAVAKKPNQAAARALVVRRSGRRPGDARGAARLSR